MFSLDRTMRYWIYPYPADMRKSFYTLSGLVTNQMGQSILTGDVFIFINRSCNCMKILHMECGGLVIYHLRLESGRFRLPVFDEDSRSYHTSWQELMLLVQPKHTATTNRKKQPVFQ